MTLGRLLGLTAALTLGAAAAVGARPRASLGQTPATAHVYLPLAGRSADVRGLPSVPTAVPPTPTATPTEAPTATPVICPALPERLTDVVADVSPAEVSVPRRPGDASQPIYLAPSALPDGAFAIAWADTRGQVHITEIQPEGTVTADYRYTGDEVRGFVVHPDGYALIVVRGDTVSFLRLDAAGGEMFNEHVIGGGSQTVAGNKWVDSWGHEGRLVWDGSAYGLYLGHTQYWGANGKHQGDLLWLFDAQGQLQERPPGWDWGCSHSLDLRLAHNDTRFGPVCLSDAYPTKGFQFNHGTEIRKEPSGDEHGYSAANLGGLVPLADGFVMSFTSPEGRGSADVGLIHVTNEAEVGDEVWLTETRGVDEAYPHLARYGDGLLAEWTAGSSRMVANTTNDGLLQAGPVELNLHVAPRDDLVGLPSGDVAWGYALITDPGHLHVGVMRWCQAAHFP